MITKQYYNAHVHISLGTIFKKYFTLVKIKNKIYDCGGSQNINDKWDSTYYIASGKR